MTERQQVRALHVITDYDRRSKGAASALALMMEALDRAATYPDVIAGVREQFTDPLASRIVRAITQ